MPKRLIGSIVLVLATCGWGTMSAGEQRPAPQGELRVVDNSPLNWQYIVLNTFEHLVEFDKEGTLVPHLATGWRWLDDRTLEMTGAALVSAPAQGHYTGALTWVGTVGCLSCSLS
jgi:hypothetical protein